MCEVDEFRCPGSGGSCMPLNYQCDFVVDCADGYDEQNCTSKIISISVKVTDYMKQRKQHKSIYL